MGRDALECCIELPMCFCRDTTHVLLPWWLTLTVNSVWYQWVMLVCYQDDSELPRDPVKLDLPASLKQVLDRDRQRVKVQRRVSYLRTTSVQLFNTDIIRWRQWIMWHKSMMAECARFTETVPGQRHTTRQTTTQRHLLTTSVQCFMLLVWFGHLCS